MNDRIRREGTHNLVDAALAISVTVFVYPSITVVFPSSSDMWIDAISTKTDAIEFLNSTIDAENEVTRFGKAGRRAISLRMGTFAPYFATVKHALNSSPAGDVNG